MRARDCKYELNIRRAPCFLWQPYARSHIQQIALGPRVLSNTTWRMQRGQYRLGDSCAAPFHESSNAPWQSFNVCSTNNCRSKRTLAPALNIPRLRLIPRLRDQSNLFTQQSNLAHAPTRRSTNHHAKLQASKATNMTIQATIAGPLQAQGARKRCWDGR